MLRVSWGFRGWFAQITKKITIRKMKSPVLSVCIDGSAIIYTEFEIAKCVFMFTDGRK